MRVLFLRRNCSSLAGALKNYHNFCFEVSKHADCKFAGQEWSLHKAGEGIKQTVKRVYGKNPPNWVIDKDHEGFKHVPSRNFKFGAFISDLHGKHSHGVHDPQGFVNLINNARYDIVLSKYECIYNRGVQPDIFPKQVKGFRWLPWSVDPEEFKPAKPKNFDVTYLGSVNGVYPFRRILKAQLPQYCHSRGLKLLFRQPPNLSLWETKEADYVKSPHLLGKRYAATLNHSRFYIFGCSIYRYPLLRFFEGMSAGCTVVSTKPSSAAKLGFVDGKTYVEVNKDNWHKKLDYYIKHPNEAKQIAEAGRKLILKRHTRKIRAKQFIAYLEANK